MSSILLDIEWLLSTLFDASLLTFEPPETAAPFFLLSRFGPYRARFRSRLAPACEVPPGLSILHCAAAERNQTSILLAVPAGRLVPGPPGAPGRPRIGGRQAWPGGNQAWPGSNYVSIFVARALDIGA
jgi:hypothetical protein